VFSEIVQSYLKRITFADDGWAERIALPQYGRATVIADPRFSFGQPTFGHGRARVADVLDRFWAGEDLDDVADDFGIPKADLEDAVRVASRRAPDLFIDRSLGRLRVPAGLRAAGLRLATLAEHDGMPADEDVDDTTWLHDVGQLVGWTVFMKDSGIRRRRAEQAALVDGGVRAFCLTRQDLRAEEMVRRFLNNLAALTAACAEAGPFIDAVHVNRIDRLQLT